VLISTQNEPDNFTSYNSSNISDTGLLESLVQSTGHLKQLLINKTSSLAVQNDDIYDRVEIVS
jgi:hypothetical protein